MRNEEVVDTYLMETSRKPQDLIQMDIKDSYGSIPSSFLSQVRKLPLPDSYVIK